MFFKKAVDVVKANLAEFKDFAFKGNLLQLAIAVVLGSAFSKLITSFVDNLFLPILSVFGAQSGGSTPGYATWQFRGIKFGQFLGDLISFLIVALAIFLLMVKVVGLIAKLTVRKPSSAEDPTEKECPYCLMKVPFKAVKCGHCTSDLPALPPVA